MIINHNAKLTMLSRVAESIYWMARYVERAENIARFIDVTLNLILDQPGSSRQPWKPLIDTTGDEEIFAERYGEPTAENVIRFLAFDSDYPHSILSCLKAARENARTVREAISSESWEVLNDFYHLVNNTSPSQEMFTGAMGYFSDIRLQSHLFHGTLDATMSRGKGWHFANLGRMLERADKTSRILDVKYFTLLPTVDSVGTTIDDLQWSAVLRSVSAFEMYRKRYHSITIHRVVEFLILDRDFPRSVNYCLIGADQSLHAISRSPQGSYQNEAEQALGQLQSDLAFSDVQTIINQGMHEFIDGLQRRFNHIGRSIHGTFFASKVAAPTTDHHRVSYEPAPVQSQVM